MAFGILSDGVKVAQDQLAVLTYYLYFVQVMVEVAQDQLVLLSC